MTDGRPVRLDQLTPAKFDDWPYQQDLCQTCAMCASACPVSGVDGYDPRKMVRMVSLGMLDRLAGSRWPWICTMCGKCEQICPMGIDIADITRRVRSLREGKKVPGILYKGLRAALETGNNLRLPKQDFVFILEDVAEEVAAEPGFEGFSVPIDKKGARLLTTVHNKLVNTHTEDLKPWWKLFFAAGEDWTVASDNWEGTSWGYFTGDDEAMRTMAGRIVENMRRLEVDTLLWPE